MFAWLPTDAAHAYSCFIEPGAGTEYQQLQPFFQAKNGWSISYGFAYPDWDPPAAPGEPPDKRGYRGGAGG